MNSPLFYLIFFGACVGLFGFASLPHAPRKYTVRLVLTGIIGFLPLVLALVGVLRV